MKSKSKVLLAALLIAASGAQGAAGGDDAEYWKAFDMADVYVRAKAVPKTLYNFVYRFDQIPIEQLKPKGDFYWAKRANLPSVDQDIRSAIINFNNFDFNNLAFYQLKALKKFFEALSEEDLDEEIDCASRLATINAVMNSRPDDALKDAIKMMALKRL